MRGKWDEISGPIECIVFSKSNDDLFIGIFWNSNDAGIFGSFLVQVFINLLISLESLSHAAFPFSCKMRRNSNFLGLRQTGGGHFDVAGAGLLAIAELSDFKKFISEEH